MERFGRIAIKTILWIIASIIFLVLLVFVLIQVPAVQNFAKDKAVNYLQGKIHTKVAIGHITLGLPKMLVLEDVYFEDQHRDTLIAGDKLKVDISMLKLLDHKLEVNEINLDGITANISRNKDSVFNFDYIVKAFAGEQKKEPKPEDTTSTMKFSLDKIILDKINVKYNDSTTGNYVKILLGHFDTRVKKFDLDKMKFSIPKINLSDVNATVIQTPTGSSIQQAAAVDTATKPMNLSLDLGTIDINRIKVNYQAKEMKTKVDLGKFNVEFNGLDLVNQKVDIKSVELSNTNAGLVLAKPQTVAKAVVKTAKKVDTLITPPASTKPWSVSVGKITLANDNVKFDNDAIKPMGRGLDYGHMDIKGINTDIEDLKYAGDSASGKINQFTFSDKSGLALKNFHTAFFYGSKKSYLNDLLIETPNSVIQKQVEVSYPSIDAVSKDISKLGVNANLDGSHIGLRDILLVMPTMASMEPFKSYPNSTLRIDGRVAGQVNNLKIQNLEIRGLSDTHILASATLKGLPDVNKAYFDVNLGDLNTSRRDIYKLVPRNMIPASVSIPEKLNLKGTLKGSMKDLNTKLILRSSYGAVDVNAHVKNANNIKYLSYNANAKVNNLNAGALIKQPQMVGRLTLSANVQGAGADPKHLNLKFNANVASAYVKGYNYRNLVAKGSAVNGRYNAVATMRDPNINFSLNAKADMNRKYPAVNATFNIDSINVQALHFSKDPMRVHGKLVADFPTADPDYLNGKALLTDIIVVNKGQRIALDTVSLVSTANADSSSLRLKTPVFTAHLGGKYKLTEIAAAMQDQINKYYNTSLASQTARPKYSPQQFTFDIRAVQTPLLKQLAPDLKQLDPILINGRFNSTTGDILVNGSVPKVRYGTNDVTNAKLNINTANNALNYSFTVDDIKVGTSLNILYLSVAGNAQNNKLNVDVQMRDIARKQRFRLAGVFSAMPGSYQFSFLQNGLMLDYAQWAVNPNNALQFGNKGILARDFTISNAGQVFSVNSNPQQPNAPINVKFTNFQIETITKMARQDTTLVGGAINGTATVSDLQASPKFIADLNINNFTFRQDTVGNVAIKVNNQTANAYAANVSITGYGNQVDLTGVYYTAPQSRFDMNLNIVNLGMKSIQGFTFGSIRNSTGNITGQLKIAGTVDAPAVRGDVKFNQVGFNVSMLNSYFRMPNESISFTNDGVHFNDFALIDSTGNKAVITGAVYTTDYKNFKFGMDINADDFRVINSTQADNKLYYGKLFIDTKIRVRGDMVKPIVDGSLTVNDKTDLTIVLPTADPSIEDRKGVVEFIDQDAPKTDSVLLAKQLDSLRKSEVTGLDVNMVVKINKKANFNIVIDERNGDVVHIKGEAQLQGGIDPSGKVNLTGTYTVAEGSYNLSYATVSRKFNFKPGSTIVWTGDPTSAQINLTATYVANVPPIDLISDQASSTDAQNTMLKQKLPFNVDLNLKNQLMAPQIGFDITLPDSNYTVSPDIIQMVNTRLDQVRTDQNELNKQVLGVLVLGHFIGDNPLQSRGPSTSAEGIVRNSVSSLLSDQLNRLAGDLIAGVNLNFDLTSGEDYSTGTAQNRTDLNVGLSKQFLNDRLTVTVGNNFNLEGANQPGERTTNIAGNIGVNYKLSKDGRYTLRAYRRDQYIVLQGQVIETGVGFTLTVEYNRFKQIFSKMTRQQRELHKQYKKEEKEKKKDDNQSNEKQPADVKSSDEQTSSEEHSN
ncbi:translocation/assembly module TamB domain-containing protein [Mucilaginibacter sp. KACC 22063]|uniref:translocation/assembly module TamB domain-containing protein n=1 Tax=Mucilaginibacter sp. KACC 22063 TaxID=3025666 RepID=UPI002366BFDF|nr:translocation/assembly module TamB domain-containing protein [Mucilaginibacter sp. KACC 22063]WDF56777.1 translocation/assembly module TamB domain-containing protein [Mucilaginibacter sp. KACC 22063]